MVRGVESARAVIIRYVLYGNPHAVANILNKRVSGPPIALSNLVRKDQFGIGVDAAPQPEIAALVFGLYEPTPVHADILPLLIHFDSHAWKIAKVFVHVICERLARFTDNTRNSFLVRLEHTGD